MYGCHKDLPVDAFLALSPSKPGTMSYMDNMGKLKACRAFSYDVASQEVRKNADRHEAMDGFNSDMLL